MTPGRGVYKTESDINFCFGGAQEPPPAGQSHPWNDTICARLTSSVDKTPARPVVGRKRANSRALLGDTAESLSVAHAQHDFPYGGAILKRCDRGSGVLQRVDGRLRGRQPARGEQPFEPRPLFGQGVGMR